MAVPVADLKFALAITKVVISLHESGMKMITATEANRDFSKLLEEVVAGRSIGITKHGRMVATINPVGRDNDEAEAFKRAHLMMALDGATSPSSIRSRMILRPSFANS